MNLICLFFFVFLETKLLNSIGYTETAPAAVETVKSCWDDHHITQTGFIIRAKMPPPPKPRFTLTAGWGNTQKSDKKFYQLPDFSAKIFISRILKEKFHKNIFEIIQFYQWRLDGICLVMISHLESSSNVRRPNQVAPPHSSGSTPMFYPTSEQKRYAQKKQGGDHQNSPSEICPRPKAGSGQLPNTDSIPIVNDQMTSLILDFSCKETDTSPRYLTD